MAILQRVSEWIERSRSIDGVAAAVHRPVLAAAGPSPLRDLLSGTWLGHPVHPLLVAGPIGCWSSALLMDATGRPDAARTLVGAGVLAAVPTAATGLSDWADTTGAEQRIGFAHLAGNLSAMACFTASWWARRRGRSGLAWTVAGSAAVGASGWLGGHLAYRLGVGVDTTAFDGGPSEWTTAHVDAAPTSTGAAGDLAAAHAGGISLVVVGSGEDRSVLAGRCTHRGAPLAEGTLEEGCVVCPWHGSRFDRRSGALRRGPAVAGQPAYQHRTVGGHLEVRRDEPRTLRTNSARPPSTVG